MSGRDRREILRAARSAIATAAYTKRPGGEVFTRPLTRGVLGWVSLMADPADDGIIEISPRVGVRHERLHELVDGLTGRDSGTAPTVSKILGYLTPARTANLVWRFDDPAEYDAQAGNMVEAISRYGHPYMQKNSELDQLVETLPKDGLYAATLLPAAYLLTGDTYRASEAVAAELDAIGDRHDPAAEAFREFAKRFEAEIGHAAD